MKNKIGKVRRVHLKFIRTEDWLKTRNKDKDKYCENCGKSHEEEEFIVIANVEGRLNAHLCRNCGLEFIKQGAIDIVKSQEEKEKQREKLINQAIRLGHRFGKNHNDYRRPVNEYTNNDLKKLVANIIKEKREEFYDFLEYKYRDKVEKLHNIYKENGYYTNISTFDFYQMCKEILWDYDIDEDYNHHKWLSYFTATKYIGDKVIKYTWAIMNGDGNIFDEGGFEMNYVWESMQFYEKKDLIDDKAILNWLELNNPNPEIFKPTIREYVKKQILH